MFAVTNSWEVFKYLFCASKFQLKRKKQDHYNSPKFLCKCLAQGYERISDEVQQGVLQETELGDRSGIYVQEMLRLRGDIIKNIESIH